MNSTNYHIAIPLLSKTTAEKVESTALYLKPLINRITPQVTFLAGKENLNIGLNILDETMNSMLESCGLADARMVKKDMPMEFLLQDFINSHKPNMIILGVEDTEMKKLNELDQKIIENSKIPIMNIKGKNLNEKIRNVILPVALSDDYDMIIRKAIKVLKPFKNLNLHVVSVLFAADPFTVNKATQQLSVINNFLEQSDIKYTAEIINCLTPGENKSEIVSDHIRRVNGDLIMLFKNQNANSEEFILTNKMREIIVKSSIPVLSFQ